MKAAPGDRVDDSFGSTVDDLSIAVPEGAVPLVIGTRRWWEVRESARWVVTNEWLRGRYVKQPFQTVLQTWHGSMYKRIGMDRGGAGFRGGGHQDRARAERANWEPPAAAAAAVQAAFRRTATPRRSSSRHTSSSATTHRP